MLVPATLLFQQEGVVTAALVCLVTGPGRPRFLLCRQRLCGVGASHLGRLETSEPAFCGRATVGPHWRSPRTAEFRGQAPCWAVARGQRGARLWEGEPAAHRAAGTGHRSPAGSDREEGAQSQSGQPGDVFITVLIRGEGL